MADVGHAAAPQTGAVPVGALFQARYPELVRLADLLGADDPEDIAQEAFARLIQRQRALRDQDAALAYVRSTVCNLVRNRHRHLRVVRMRTPRGHDEASSEQAVMLREDRRRAAGRAGGAVSAAPGSDRAPVLARSIRAGDGRHHAGVGGNREIAGESWPGRAQSGAGGQDMNTLEDRLRAALAERATL